MKKYLIFTIFCFVVAVQGSISLAEPDQGEAVKEVQVHNPAKVGVIEAFRSASIIVQMTMLLLMVMSVISWAIIFSKWNLFKSNTVNNAPFEDVFFKASSLDDILNMSKSYPKSSCRKIYKGTERRTYLSPL